MAVRNDLVPLPVVKTWAKRLVKALPEVSTTSTPGLSVCQEAIARVLGHSNWQALLRNYEAPPSMKENTTATTNQFSFEPAFEGEPSQMILYIQSMLTDALKRGDDAIHIERSKEHALIKARKGDLIYDVSINAPRAADELISVFYNVLSQNREVAFYPHKTQTASMRVRWNDSIYQLLYKSAPSRPGEYHAAIEICPTVASPSVMVGAQSAKIKQLCAMEGGVILLCSSNSASRRAALGALAVALCEDSHALILSTGEMPLLANIQNATFAPLVRGIEQGAAVHWGVARGPRFHPYGAALVDCQMTSTDWDSLGLVRKAVGGAPVFVSVDAISPVEALVELDKMGKLRDLLRYGQLKCIAKSDDQFGCEHNPIEHVRMLTPDTQNELLNSAPNQWEEILQRK